MLCIRGMTLLLIMGLVFSVSAAAEKAEVTIVVTWQGEEVSENSQIMIAGQTIPMVFAPGQPKTAELAPGTYEIMAMLVDGEVGAMPAQTRIELAGGERKTVEMELEAMPGMPMPDTDFPGTAVEPETAAFDPEDATDAELLDMLVQGDAADQTVAVEELSRHRRRDTAPQLLDLILSSSGETRRLAMEALRGLGREMPDGMRVGTRPIDDVMDRILVLLDDSDLQIRIGAAEIVEYAWYFPDDAVPYLIAGLKDTELDMRKYSARALGSYGMRSDTHAEELFTALSEAAAEDSEIVRRLAVEALRWVPVGGSRRAGAAAPLLSDPAADVRKSAAEVITAVREDAGGVVPQLVAALEDEETAIRALVLRAMAGCDPDALSGHLEPIAAMLYDPERLVRRRAAEALANAGEGALAVQSEMAAALLDDYHHVARIVASIHWVHFGSDSQPATPQLAQLLQREEGDFREAASSAAHALAAIGEPAIPTLIDLLHRDGLGTKYRAATALNTIGPAAADAAPRLLELYQDEDEYPDVRRAAFFAIVSITGEEPDA